MTHRWTRSALLLAGMALVAAALASTAAARVDARGSAKATSVNVAFIYPKTGGLAAFGQEEFGAFRAGRQTLQDVEDAANVFPPKTTGKKVVVFAEDTAFGQGNFAAVNAIFGGKGHTVTKILSPFGVADLTPYAQQLKNSNADAAFVAWANTTNSASMWQALQQQGVPQKMTIITGLANREVYDAIGPLVSGITLLSHYVYTAPRNRSEERRVGKECRPRL